MRIDPKLNIYNPHQSSLKNSHFTGCPDCKDASCAVKPSLKVPRKRARFDAFKLIGNGFKLLALGVFLYAGYQQFFNNDNKSRIKTNSINVDRIKTQGQKLIDQHELVLSKDTLTKLYRK